MLIEESNYIMHCVVGSTAHGVALPGRDDRDEMAVYVEPPAHVTGHRRPIDSRCTRTAGEGERSTADDIDVMAYSLRHWASLALQGNPSILVGLFAAPFLDSEEWRQVQDARDLILSRLAHPRFLGYLHEQRARLIGSGKSSRMPKRPELIARTATTPSTPRTPSGLPCRASSFGAPADSPCRWKDTTGKTCSRSRPEAWTSPTP